MTERGEALQDLSAGQVVQFHGKWPFKRFLGVQEPASVVFSAMDLLAHASWYGVLFRRMPLGLPVAMKRAYQGYHLASLNLWIWSVVFHTRDKGWTEKMDYFSAALGTILSLYVAILRLAHIYTDSPRDRLLRQLTQLLLAGVFLGHISYLSLWRFDYSYNMAFNLAIALLHNFLWYGWTLHHFQQPRRNRPAHYLRPTLVLTWLSSLMAFELFDFPPWRRLVDAHALWHLATVPVIGAWYRFYLADARYLVETRHPARL
jgi:hypothetical protein